MSKINLVTALVEHLRLDVGVGSLVALTGHTVTQMKIARDSPPVKGRTPFLGVAMPVSMPLMGVYVTQVQRGTAYFYCQSKDEVLAEQLADRIEYLLHNNTITTVNTDYYDFSNSDVSVRGNRFVSRIGSDFDAKLEVWLAEVRAEVIWTNTSCP